MKTEKEFCDYFLDSCQHEKQFDDYLKNLAPNYWNDLTTHLNSYFKDEDRLRITQKAAELLSQNLKLKPIENAWPEVIRNFINENQWGFSTTNIRPVKKQTEEQKIFWSLFKYTWAFIQSMIILKIAVYYFGLESAQNPDETNVLWVWLFFGISAGSLALFAFRNRNDHD